MTNDISTLDFAAFDTETTGLNPHSERLVEVAAVRFSLLGGPKEYFQALVHPGMPIPPQATRVHGITDAMVAGSPPLEKVLPSFFHFLRGAVPVAHNARFDIGFLSLHGLRTGAAPPEGPVLDSCMLSRRVFRGQPSFRLQALVEALGIPANAFHRAQADAGSCMELFRQGVQAGCGPRASWDELLALHGRPTSFQEGSRPLAREGGSGLAPLFAALETRRPVWIQYEGGYGAREVTPLLLYASGSQRYMEATCHLDGIRKSFRLDRIRRVYETAQAEGRKPG